MKYIVGLLLILSLEIGCKRYHGDADMPAISDVCAGSRKFLFGHRGKDETDSFIACASDSNIIATVEAELALPIESRYKHINGKIAKGNGGHNLNWDWHFIPNQWRLAELSVEVCDGWASDVQQNLDYWVNNVGFFCPWASYVRQEVNSSVQSSNPIIKKLYE